MAKRSSISSAWPSNAIPWPGSTVVDRHLARLRSDSMYISSARAPAPLAGPPPSGAEISGFDEMWLIR